MKSSKSIDKLRPLCVQLSLNFPIADNIPYEIMTIGGIGVGEFPISQHRQKVENYMSSEDGDEDVFYCLIREKTLLSELFSEQEIKEHFPDVHVYDRRYFLGCIFFTDRHIDLPVVGENDLTFINNNLYVYLSPCSSLKLCLQIAMYNNVVVNLWHSLHRTEYAIPHEATVRINAVRHHNIQLPDERARDIYVGLRKPIWETLSFDRYIFKATIDSDGKVELPADPEINSLYDLAHELSLDYLWQTWRYGEWAARPTIATRAIFFQHAIFIIFGASMDIISDEVCAVYDGVQCQEQTNIFSIVESNMNSLEPYQAVLCDYVVKNISVS